jgi:hypothetical protein
MAIDPIKVWADMRLRVWPERYWMVELSLDARELVGEVLEVDCGRYISLIRDQACLSLIINEATWQNIRSQINLKNEFGPFRMISTEGELPFDVIGFL